MPAPEVPPTKKSFFTFSPSPLDWLIVAPLIASILAILLVPFVLLLRDWLR